MSTVEKFEVHGGDILEVQWTGSVWVAPTCGAQYAHRSDAMRQELQDYLRACGEEADADELDLSEHGEWVAGEATMSTTTDLILALVREAGEATDDADYDVHCFRTNHRGDLIAAAADSDVAALAELRTACGLPPVV